MVVPPAVKTTTPTSSSSAWSAAPSGSLVHRARLVRERKNGIGRSIPSSSSTSTATDDGDAMMSALFDDDFASSLESAVSAMWIHRRAAPPSSATPKDRAEEYDRFVEEDVAVASMVRVNVRPGGIVNEARRGGVDLEEALRREAAVRRRGREATTGGEACEASVAVADAVDIEIDATGRVPAVPSPVRIVRGHNDGSRSHSPPRGGRLLRRKGTTKPAMSSSVGRGKGAGRGSALLTPEEEYALARTIRSGARVHKLRIEYESSRGANDEPISKREWARLAGMTPNDLRKLISDYRKAKGELVSRNVGLVRAVVRSLYARRAEHRGVPIEELIQEGSLGLIRAAELFDPSRGLRFSTYATIWIKGVLSNSNTLDDMIILPSREKTIHNKVRKAWEDMAMEAGDVGGGGKPSASSAEVLATRLNMDRAAVEQHLRRMACVTNVLSLDYQYSSSTRSGHASGDRDEALRSCSQFGTDADLAERAQLKADVVSGLVKNLTERELTLMRLRYGLEDGTEYTLKECAERMGINKETARLLQHACLKKLREASNMESLQEYLLTVA
jgi:RNA polymerase primary sigma factor